MSVSIRWGIVGTGTVAGEFARGLQSVDAGKLTAVASRQQPRAQRFAAAFGATSAYGSYDEMLADSSVDVVYIATPHVRHHQDCLAALRAGKHVLCEKPIAINAEQTRQIAAAADDAARFCMEAMWMRFMPLVQRLRTWLMDGRLGTPCALDASFGVPTPFHPHSRFFDPALGGGALLDRGVYIVSLAQLLFGQPQRIEAHSLSGRTGVDEHTSFLLTYGAGHAVTGTCSLRMQLPNDAKLVGSHGTATLNAPFFRPNQLTWQACPPVASAEQPVTLPIGGTVANLTRALKESGFGQTLTSRWLPALRTLRGPRGECHSSAILGNGYGYEALEVARCIACGAQESPLMTWSDSIGVMETIDQLRLA